MFWQRFYDLCVGIGSKPNPVGKQLEIASSTITQWKKGSSPSGDSLLKLSDFFGVSTDYLLGRTDTPAMENSGMTADEQALLANYRLLNADGKKKANEYIVDLVKGGVYSDTVTKDIAAFGGADTITVSQEQLDEAIKKLLREQGLI